MIDSIRIQDIIEKYKVSCLNAGRSPTFKGLASLLGCSPGTIRNVTIGSFNGCSYTDKPAPRRCVCNDDFELVRGLFER